MADLLFDVDIEEVVGKIEGLKEEIKSDLQQAVGGLSKMTHAKLQELASTELSSLQRLYQDNIVYEEPAKNMWVVTLKEPAMWIEEGRKSGFMDELLKTESPESQGKVKQGKNGKYRVIPFRHNVNPTEQSPKAQALANQIREAMESKGIRWKKIEKTAQGSPRIGLLHRFDVESARISEKHKTDPLKNIAVYQKKNKETGKVEKHVVTFRVISEKHKQEGLWNHPGRAGNKLMDKAYDWALKTWENEILPATLKKYE